MSGDVYSPKCDPGGNTLGTLYREQATFLAAIVSPSLSYKSRGNAFLPPLRIDFRGLAGCPAVGFALEDDAGTMAGVCGRRMSALVTGREGPMHGSSGRDSFRSFGVSGMKPGLVGEWRDLNMTIVIKYKSVVAERRGMRGGQNRSWSATVSKPCGVV